MDLQVSGRPTPPDCDSAYASALIDAVAGDDVRQVLQTQRHWLDETSQRIPAAEVDVVHPPYGWTVRQVMQHLCDAERVFGYRMLRLAAGDQTPLPGWDETAYGEAGFDASRPFAALVEETALLRQANLLLLQRLPQGGWDRGGTASGTRITVRGVAWLMAGHFQHHLRIVRQRLGLDAV